jgi:hypothetical protein
MFTLLMHAEATTYILCLSEAEKELCNDGWIHPISTSYKELCDLKCETCDSIKQEEVLHHELSIHSEVMCGLCYAAFVDRIEQQIYVKTH